MWGMKICSNFAGHMTMLIYGKKIIEFFFETKRPMTMILNILHQVLDYHNLFSNDDPELTLTMFMTGSNLFSY